MKYNSLIKIITTYTIALSPFVHAENTVQSSGFTLQPSVITKQNKIYKIKLLPDLDEMLVSDITVNANELRRIQAEHISAPPDNDVTPCLAPAHGVSGFLRAKKFFKLEDIQEIIIDPALLKSDYSTTAIAKAVVIGYGFKSYFPLQVTTNSGEVFVIADTLVGYGTGPWRACNAIGEHKRIHAFPFFNATIRLVNTSRTLGVANNLIISLERLSDENVDELIFQQTKEFAAINQSRNIKALTSFIVTYLNKDVASLVPIAVSQLEKATGK